MTLDVLELQEQVSKLNKQLKKDATNLSKSDLRFFVDMYYQIQRHRIRAGLQVKTAKRENEEPNPILIWIDDNFKKLEQYVKTVLDLYTSAHPVGKWAKSIPGIGPVTSAALLAFIDIEKAPTVGHIWRYAGLDPTIEWGPGQKRPYNARLKTICYHISAGFVRNKNRANFLYGEIYEKRKEYESEKNEWGEYREQAKQILQKRKIGKDTEAYKYYVQGKLPPAHIDARARRYTVKLFLSHLHEVWYRVHYRQAPPKPFVIEHLGHADYIKPPNLHLIEEYF